MEPMGRSARAAVAFALALALLGACTSAGTEESRSTAVAPTATEEERCAGVAAPPVADETFVPPSEVDAGVATMPVVFADGSRAVLEAPQGVGLHRMSARPDMSGGARKEWVRPSISFGGTPIKVTGPVDCVRGERGRDVPVWEGKWLGRGTDRLMYLRFGDWYVQVLKRPRTDLSYWARRLRGHTDNDGWVQLYGTGALRLGPQRRGADSSIMFFDRKNIMSVWIVDCEDRLGASDGRITGLGSGSFVSFCPAPNVEVHVQGERRFVEGIAEGLVVREVQVAYPLDRYAIVP